MRKSPEQILASTKNQYSYCCVSASGKVFAHKEDRLTETASTIKLLIMAYAFHLAEEGKLSLEKPVKVSSKDVGQFGSGIVPLFYRHQPIELYNLIVLMMTVSDNMATNVLIRLLGTDNINEYARQIGLEQTRLEMDFLSFDNSYRLGAKTKVGVSTAREMAQLVDQIINGKLYKKHYTHLSKKLMSNVQASRASKRLPFKVDGSGTQEFGSKTGTLIDWDSNYLFAEAGFMVDKNKRCHIFSILCWGKLESELPLSSDSENVREFAELAAALYYRLEHSK